jgi:hypothetical protein
MQTKMKITGKLQVTQPVLMVVQAGYAGFNRNACSLSQSRYGNNSQRVNNLQRPRTLCF